MAPSPGRTVNTRRTNPRSADGYSNSRCRRWIPVAPVTHGRSAGAADDGPQLLHPGRDLALGPVGRRPVVVDTHDFVGRILLGHNAVRVVMGIPVADGVAQLLRARVVPVAQVG